MLKYVKQPEWTRHRWRAEDKLKKNVTLTKIFQENGHVVNHDNDGKDRVNQGIRSVEPTRLENTLTRYKWI